MGYARQARVRSSVEKAFIYVYPAAVITLYTFLKWPDFLAGVGVIEGKESLYFFGKNPSFWYISLYTLIVCGIAGKIVLTPDKSPYNPAPKAKLVKYQKAKFATIFLSQLLFFFVGPFIVAGLLQDGGFFNDPVVMPKKMAHVYISPAFVSWFWAFWIFLLIPVVVYFFGKRYCSWFCSCGNLAETIGTTKWGNQWVQSYTPTGEGPTKAQNMQTVFMTLGFVVGFILLLDGVKVISAPTLVEAGLAYQDLIIDFVFGSLIGVGLYPFFGTRIWCRYGCPMARFMELFGRYAKSRYKVQANGNCKGIGLCSTQCPMGIDVASYAHKDKKPILGSFGLNDTTCIGCGGCVDRCPTDALEFVSPFAARS